MEIFKQLNKKGYKHYYDGTVEELDSMNKDNQHLHSEIMQVVMWLYEKHRIWISVLRHTKSGKGIYFESVINIMTFSGYNSPTEAYEAAIEHTLNNFDMKEQFVTYEIALKLKELGFDEPCLAYFEDKELMHGMLNNLGKRRYLVSPLWQQVIDWFRERYNLHLVPIYSYNDILHWSYHIEDIVTGECYIPLIDDGLTLKSTKYEAREQAILKAIEIINGRNI